MKLVQQLRPVLSALLACCTAVQVPEEYDARRVRLEIEDLGKIKADLVTAAVWMHQANLKGIVDILAHAAAIQTAWGVIFRLKAAAWSGSARRLRTTLSTPKYQISCRVTHYTAQASLRGATWQTSASCQDSHR